MIKNAFCAALAAQDYADAAKAAVRNSDLGRKAKVAEDLASAARLAAAKAAESDPDYRVAQAASIKAAQDAFRAALAVSGSRAAMFAARAENIARRATSAAHESVKMRGAAKAAQINRVYSLADMARLRARQAADAAR